MNKIQVNRTRDRRVNRALLAKGWRVIRCWEHDLTARNTGRCVKRIARALTQRRLTVPRRRQVL